MFLSIFTIINIFLFFSIFKIFFLSFLKFIWNNSMNHWNVIRIIISLFMNLYSFYFLSILFFWLKFLFFSFIFCFCYRFWPSFFNRWKYWWIFRLFFALFWYLVIFLFWILCCSRQWHCIIKHTIILFNLWHNLLIIYFWGVFWPSIQIHSFLDILSSGLRRNGFNI